MLVEGKGGRGEEKSRLMGEDGNQRFTSRTDEGGYMNPVIISGAGRSRSRFEVRGR